MLIRDGGGLDCNYGYNGERGSGVCIYIYLDNSKYLLLFLPSELRISPTLGIPIVERLLSLPHNQIGAKIVIRQPGRRTGQTHRNRRNPLKGPLFGDLSSKL